MILRRITLGAGPQLLIDVPFVTSPSQLELNTLQAFEVTLSRTPSPVENVSKTLT
jgi:hypothetical protein